MHGSIQFTSMLVIYFLHVMPSCISSNHTFKIIVKYAIITFDKYYMDMHFKIK